MKIMITIEFADDNRKTFEFYGAEDIVGFSLPVTEQEWTYGIIKVKDRDYELYDHIEQNKNTNFSVAVYNNGKLIGKYIKSGEIDYDILSRIAVLKISSTKQ